MTGTIPRPEDGVAWITGASSGIGRELALILARDGWTVCATARRKSDLDSLVADATPAKGQVLAFEGDVTDAGRMAAVVSAIETGHGPIVLAVLNAGIYLPVSDVPFDREAYIRSFDVNLGGTVNCLAPLLPEMVKRGNGQLWLMASVAGYSGLPTSAAYGATKAGLMNMAESLKFDLDKRGVHIGIINPGFVKTPATDKNAFPMPFLMPVEDAAQRIADGLKKGGFEITFPRRFSYILKFLRVLPHFLYFPVVAGMTGWNKRPVTSSGKNEPPIFQGVRHQDKA